MVVVCVITDELKLFWRNGDSETSASSVVQDESTGVLLRFNCRQHLSCAEGTENIPEVSGEVDSQGWHNAYLESLSSWPNESRRSLRAQSHIITMNNAASPYLTGEGFNWGKIKSSRAQLGENKSSRAQLGENKSLGTNFQQIKVQGLNQEFSKSITRITGQRVRLSKYLKLKNEIIRKAQDLSDTCGVDVGVVAFSPIGQLTTFANCGRIEDLFLRYFELPPEERGGAMKNEKEIVEKLQRLKGRLEMIDQLSLKRKALLEETELLHEKIDEAKERLRILAARPPTSYNIFLARLHLVKIVKPWPA